MSELQLQRLLAYDFKNPSLFVQALTHRSHSGKNNERLEFLGDGVLNCIIASQLYQRYPQLSEGELSRLRALLVKEATLSEIAFGLHLGESLKLGEGELKSAGWRRPSVLADALEAIIGAVYVDGGFSHAEQLVLHLFGKQLDALNPKQITKDAKSTLQELLQAKKLELPQYTVTLITGEAHCQVFTVECQIEKLNITTQGSGQSRRAAEQLAAEAALEQIEQRRRK